MKNYIYLFLILIITVAACKTPTKIFKKKLDLKPIKAHKLYENIIGNELKYKTLLIKFSTTYQDSATSHSFDGTLRILHDSIVWVSITPALGIELFRIMLTPDSLKYINVLKSNYYLGNISNLSEMYNIELDYNAVQSLLANQLFLYPASSRKEIKTFKRYKSSIESELYNLQSISERKINRKIKKSAKHPDREVAVQNIYVQPDSFKIEKVFIEDFTDSRTVTINYSDYNIVNHQSFPKVVQIELNNGGKIIKLDLKYNKIIVDKDIHFPFTISEKYERIY